MQGTPWTAWLFWQISSGDHSNIGMGTTNLRFLITFSNERNHKREGRGVRRSQEHDYVIHTWMQGVSWIHWSFFSGIFLLGGSHLWPYLVNMGTSIIWCDSNIKVQYFSVWLWYTLCSPLMAYHHNDRLHEKVSWLLPNHIPIKLLFLFSTQLN